MIHLCFFSSFQEKNSGVKVNSVSISKSFQHPIKNREPKSSCKKKEKQEVSVLLDKKSKKGNRKSVLEIHKKDMANSVQTQSICKDQSKAGSSTAPNTTDMRCKLNSCCKSKHVTFSDGTDIFGRTAHLPADNTKQPQSVQTFQQATQEGRDHRDRDDQQLVYQQAEAISRTVEITNSLSENVVPAGVCRTIPLTKPKDITILGNSVDLNHCIETCHGSNCLNSTSLASLSSKMPCQNFQGVNSHLNGNNVSSLDVQYLGEQNHMISQASFNPVSLAAKGVSGDMSPLSEPSSCCLYDRSSITFHEKADANYHLGKVSSEILRSGNVVRSISSSTGSNKPAQAIDCVSAAFRNMHSRRDDYVSLPINSRGEFVKVHPGGTPNYVDIFTRQCLGENSSCPSDYPTVFSSITRMDHVPNYHARQIYTIDQSAFHADPRFHPAGPMAYGMDVRQWPSSERAKVHYYTIPDKKYPCAKQQELSMDHNSRQKLLGLRSRCPSQNSGQGIQHNAETTLRLMGKTVTLGTSSSTHCRGLNNGTPACSSKQSQAEDRGTRTKVFPQLFHGGLALADPAPACRISDGDRQPSGHPSRFSFAPAAVGAFLPGTSSFRTGGHNQQPELATASKNPYLQPVGWRNESELGNQQPPGGTANQVQSNAEDMLMGSTIHTHCRHAPESSFDARNSVRNFVEKGPAAPYQSSSSYLTQQLSSNMALRAAASSSSCASGYGVQTKFTSLRPLPPSVVPSHAYSAPPRGPATVFHPSAPPVPYPASNSGGPGSSGAVLEIESVRWSVVGSKPEGSERLRSCKRAAEKDADVPVALLKKPLTVAAAAAAREGLDMLLPVAETGSEFRGSTRPEPDAQPRPSGTSTTPICVDDEP